MVDDELVLMSAASGSRQHESGAVGGIAVSRRPSVHSSLASASKFAGEDGSGAKRTSSIFTSASSFKTNISNLVAVTAKLRDIITQKSNNTLQQYAPLPTMAATAGTGHRKDVVSEPLAVLLTSELLHQGPLLTQQPAHRGGGQQRSLGFHLGKPYANNNNTSK